MNMRLPTKVVWICGALFWILMNSCSFTPTLEDLENGTVIPTPSSRSAFTPTVRRETIIITETATSQPTRTATGTATFTPTSSRTLEPTLLPEESQTLFLNLMQTNGGCEFPCVWGIMPGNSMEAIHRLASRIGNGSLDQFETEVVFFDETTAIGYYITDNENYLRVSFLFQQYGDPAEYLLFNAIERVGRSDYLLEQMIGYYHLANILTIYGKPSEVLIGPWWDDPDLIDEWIPFSVVIYYPEIGFLAQYLFNQDKDEEFFIGCPDPVMQFFLTTWDFQQAKSLQEVSNVQNEFYVFREGSEYYQPIETAMAMTVDEFYAQYKDPETQICLRAPRKNWVYGFLATETPQP